MIRQNNFRNNSKNVNLIFFSLCLRVSVVKFARYGACKIKTGNRKTLHG